MQSNLTANALEGAASQYHLPTAKSKGYDDISRVVVTIVLAVSILHVSFQGL